MPGHHLSQVFVAFFVHPCEAEFSCSIGTLQSTPVPPPRVEPNRKRFRANLALFLLRTVRVERASPLMPLRVVIASKGFFAVVAEVLLLRLGLLLPDSPGPAASGLLSSDLDREVDLFVGRGGRGVVFARVRRGCGTRTARGRG